MLQNMRIIGNNILNNMGGNIENTENIGEVGSLRKPMPRLDF